MGLNKYPLPSIVSTETSDYQKANDMPDGGMELTIKSVGMETVGFDESQKKVVVKFEEDSRSLVLNKTNWKIIERLTGESEAENWRGAKITLYKSEIVWQGTPTPCIRVMQKLQKVKNF